MPTAICAPFPRTEMNATDGPVHFRPAATAAFAALSLTGAVANGHCVRHVRSNFPLGKSVYLLVFLDAAIGFLCCLGGIFVCMSLMVSNDEVTCTTLFISIYTPCLLGPLLTAEIAIIRYYSLRLARKNRQLPERLALAVSIFILIIATGFVIAFVAGHRAAGVTFSKVTEFCINGEDAVPLAPPTKLGSLGPVILNPVVSLVYDALILRLLRRSIGSIDSDDDNWNNKNSFAVPVRATALSAATIAPYVAIGFFLNNVADVEPATAVTGLVVVAMVVNAFRCLLTTTVTFAARRKEIISESRAKMQERERAYARAARASEVTEIELATMAVRGLTGRGHQQDMEEASSPLRAT